MARLLLMLAFVTMVPVAIKTPTLLDAAIAYLNAAAACAGR